MEPAQDRSEIQSPAYEPTSSLEKGASSEAPLTVEVTSGRIATQRAILNSESYWRTGIGDHSDSSRYPNREPW